MNPISIIFLLVSLFVLIISARRLFLILYVKIKGKSTNGTLIGLKKGEIRDDETGGYTLYPIIEFYDQQVKITHNLNETIDNYFQYKKVEIIYIKDNRSSSGYKVVLKSNRWLYIMFSLFFVSSYTIFAILIFNWHLII